MSIGVRAMVAGPASVCALLAVGVAARAEIVPMTRQRAPQAEQVGRQAVDNHHPILYQDMCRTYAPYTVHMFEVTITTPFMAVAEAAFDAAKNGKPIDPALLPFDPAEQQRVIVAVDPAELKPGVPASVARVVIRRRGRIVEPVRSSTYQVTFPKAAAGSRDYRGLTGYFALDAFASEKGDLEIVVIPETDEAGAEAVVTLTSAHLARMR